MSTEIQKVENNHSILRLPDKHIERINRAIVLTKQLVTLTEEEYIEIFKQYVNDDEWQELIKITNESLNKYTNFYQAYFYRGFALSELEFYLEAIANFNKALAINSNYQNPYHNRGLAYYYLGDYNRAIQDYYQALRINPNNENAKYNINKAQEKLKYEKRTLTKEEYIKTKDEYINILIESFEGDEVDFKTATEAIKIYPDFDFAYCIRGIRLSNYDNNMAIEDFNKAIDINPHDSYYSCRGEAYYELGDYGNAINDFNKAIEIHLKVYPEDRKWSLSLIYFDRAKVYMKIGNNNQALMDFKKGMELYPMNRKVQEEYKKLCQMLNIK
jgi:tetratricopeptide (TPR) repeat protein